jgi:2-methylaconitate cis-trans-isomerase PrpF
MTKSLKTGHAALVLFALVAALRGAAVGQSPVSKVAEPEELGAVYFHDETGGSYSVRAAQTTRGFFSQAWTRRTARAMAVEGWEIEGESE